LVERNGAAVFDPDFDAVEKGALKAVSSIVKAASGLPRIEAKLNGNSDGSDGDRAPSPTSSTAAGNGSLLGRKNAVSEKTLSPDVYVSP
jgi:hypothetical protein